MKTRLTYYQENKIVEEKNFSSKKDAILYKKNILQQFTVHQKVKNNIQVILNH